MIAEEVYNHLLKAVREEGGDEQSLAYLLSPAADLVVGVVARHIVAAKPAPLSSIIEPFVSVRSRHLVVVPVHQSLLELVDRAGCEIVCVAPVENIVSRTGESRSCEVELLTLPTVMTQTGAISWLSELNKRPAAIDEVLALVSYFPGKALFSAKISQILALGTRVSVPRVGTGRTEEGCLIFRHGPYGQRRIVDTFTDNVGAKDRSFLAVVDC